MRQTTENSLVPFGKYRGQPVEQLAADSEYCQWLLTQSWFPERYRALHVLILNNGVLPDDTPEHNAMQLRFLSDDTCRRACRAWLAMMCSSRERLYDLQSTTFEHAGIDVRLTYSLWHWESLHANRRSYYHTYVRIDGSLRIDSSWNYDDEPYLRYVWQRGRRDETLGIELKPSVGDDYPTILRKMLAPTGALLLLFDTWASQMPLEQVQRLFQKSGRCLLPYTTLQQYDGLAGSKPCDVLPHS